jgi:hypothetical protein
MAQLLQDQIGDLGELLAAAALSRPVGGRFNRPLFRATALGGKYPTVDFLVDLLAADGAAIGFFLAQIKATYAETRTRKRLPVSVPARKFNDLVRVPVPTFLIGVDVRSETSYIVAAHRTRQRPVSSVPKTYNLSDDSVRINLYKEVQSFWTVVKHIPQQTRFDHGPK